MPKFTKNQTNFTNGEIAQAVWGRIDSDRYDASLQTCLNYIPTLQGPLIRRPGSRYVGNVKDSTKPGYLFEFQVSATVGYVLEMGDQYIRFFSNDGQVITNTTVFSILGTYGNSTFCKQPIFPFYALTDSVFGNPNLVAIGNTTLSAGSIMEMSSPYLYADLPNLRIVQDGPTAYLTHPNYPPYKLQRINNQKWVLSNIYLQDGPYLPLNSYLSLADSARVGFTVQSSNLLIGDGTFNKQPNVYKITTGSSFVIAKASGNIFTSSNITVDLIGAHPFQVGDPVYVTGVTGGIASTVNNSSVNTPFYWPITSINGSSLTLGNSVYDGSSVMTGSTGTLYPALFQLVPGKNPSNGGPGGGFTNQPAWIDMNPNQANLDLGAGIKVVGVNGTMGGRTMALVNNGTRYWGNIIGVIDPANAYIQMANGYNLPNSTAVSLWQMGTYNQSIGYPQAACLHQNRLFMAGAPGANQQFDGSFSGSYEVFSASGSNFQVTDQNAVSFKLVSQQIQPIYWMKPTAQGLLAGSLSGEWQISPSNLATGITPTNITAQQIAAFGSANIDGVALGNNILYIQKAQRKVRELNYFFNAGTYRSTNISELAEHLTLPSITKLAVQKEINPVVWGLRSDGQLISLSYSRDDVQLKAGWARHVLGGQSDAAGSPPVVKGIAVITASSGFYDQLWMSVQRSINGSNVVTIEALTRPFDYTTPQEDAFYLDCGGTYDQPLPVSALSTAASCVATVPSHGFTASTAVRFYQAVGLNSSVVDADGNTSISNLVNQQTFVVASVSVNAFKLQDFLGNDISSLGYTSYLGSSVVRKLVSTVTGATWLSGETVSALGDGGILNDSSITSSGTFPLSSPSAKVQLGYSYNSDFQLLRSHDGSAQGTSIGSTRRVNRVAMMLHNVAEISMGAKFTNLMPVEFPRADVQSADSPTLITDGIFRQNVSAEYTFDDYICFRQKAPLPGMIQSVIRFLEEFDV